MPPAHISPKCECLSMRYVFNEFHLHHLIFKAYRMTHPLSCQVLHHFFSSKIYLEFSKNSDSLRWDQRFFCCKKQQFSFHGIKQSLRGSPVWFKKCLGALAVPYAKERSLSLWDFFEDDYEHLDIPCSPIFILRWWWETRWEVCTPFYPSSSTAIFCK